MNLKNIFSYLDAAALLVIITAVLYFWGYVHYSAYFGTYGLDVASFSLSFESYLLAGWEYIFYAIGIFVTFNFLYRLVVWMDTEDRQSGHFFSRFPRLTRMIRSLISHVGLSVLYLLVFMVLAFVTLHIESEARSQALSSASKKKPIQFITKTECPLPEPLFFLYYAGGKYIVYTQSTDGGKGQVYLINDGDVSVATFPPK